MVEQIEYSVNPNLGPKSLPCCVTGHKSFASTFRAEAVLPGRESTAAGQRKHWASAKILPSPGSESALVALARCLGTKYMLQKFTSEL